MCEKNENELAQKLRENQNIDTEDHRETARETYSVVHKTHKCVKRNTAAAWVVGSGLVIWFCTVSHGKYIGSFMNSGDSIVSLRAERDGLRAERDGLRERIHLADALINNSYTESLRNTPFSSLSKHEQRHVFELAFEAGLTDILNWISDSPEVLNNSRHKILKKRIDDLNRKNDVPFARHDGMYYREKYYHLKRHHESDLHPDLNEDIGTSSNKSRPAQ